MKIWNLNKKLIYRNQTKHLFKNFTSKIWVSFTVHLTNLADLGIFQNLKDYDCINLNK